MVTEQLSNQQLIEAGDKLTMNPTVGNYEERECEWQKLVQDRKEG